MHAKALAASIKAVEAFETTVQYTTVKVEKLLAEVMKFMADFHNSSDQNTEAANKVITSLGTTLETEKEAFSKVRSDLRIENANLNASIVSKNSVASERSCC